MKKSIHRRTFIRNTSLAAGAALALPSIASAVKILGKAERQKAKHVVYCILGGGVRLNETIAQQFGSLMPNLLHGSNPSLEELDLGFEKLSAVLPKPLRASGSLYSNFRYANGVVNHYNATAAAFCGKYANNQLDYRAALSEDSIFDYYNRSRINAGKENKAVWIPNALSAYKEFAGNSKVCSLHPYHEQTLRERTERAVSFFSELPQSRLNEDLRCIAAAAESVQQHQPELLVFNLQSADICHSNYTAYCENLHLADYGIGRLWQIIQNTPGMANNTVLIVAPEHGRDQAPNSISDANKLFGYDHANDVDARNIFCMLAGPADVVAQNCIASNEGQSIDILPTIAHLLGFDHELPLLPGKMLHEALAHAV